MVIDALVRYVASKLKDNARFEAEQIVMHVLGIDRTGFITDSSRAVTDDEMRIINETAARRAGGEPLQYILGETEFMSLPFKVNRSTLIPRSDTETLVEHVLEHMNGKSCEILDIGAGTGCVGISLAHYNKNARVTELDISFDAINTARENAGINGVLGRTKFIKADILNKIPDGAYDIIVSNPPYIETAVIGTLQTEVKDYEPLSALDGGEDGLTFYRRITEIAPKMLKKGGLLAFEIGYNQGENVKKLMEKNFKDIRIIKDLCGNDRVVSGRGA